LAVVEFSKAEAQEVVGLDLGDRSSQICRLDRRTGALLEERRLSTTTASVQRYFSGLAPQLIALESGTHSLWMARLLKSLGHEVIVANPSKVRAISSSLKKTDERDARFLAQLARVDPQLLSPVQPRSEESQQAIAVVRAREGLVKARTMLINQVRGVVKSFGFRLPAGSSAGFAHKAQQDKNLPPSLKVTLEPLLRVIAEVSEEIARFDKEVEALARRWPVTQRLRQIKGVGALTALVFVLTLGDPFRFADSRAVGAYLGLVPGSRNSGQSTPQMPITKQGDRMLRRLLVQASHYVLGPFGQDSDLRRFGLRLAERGGKSGKKRAVVAVARKLAVVLHRLWVSETDYQPLRGAAA
jgi:transposase